MANIFMRFPEGKKKALTLSYDDGVEQDKRLISIMQQNGLKGTFNLNSGLYATEGTVYDKGTIHRRMTEQEVTKVYKNSGMEVAIHGFTHASYDLLPSNLCVSEIAKDREQLEKQFQVIIRGMAYPFGSYNDEVVKILEQSGIIYARTVKSTGSFQIPTDWLRLETTCHHKDIHLMEYAEKFVNDEVQWGSYLFYLWGHSYEFEEDDNWEVIEKFAEYTGKRDSVWYATNIAIFDYINAYKSLLFSMDAKRVYNPTATDVYLEINQKIICVPGGKEQILY